MLFRSMVRALPRTVAAMLLAGCGGGVFIGVNGGFDDTPPAVNLASAATRVAAGQPATFIAAASDANGIAEVAFFRVEPSGSSVLVGRDDVAPYELAVTAPNDGRAALTVFARARDNEGNSADSAPVSVTIGP